MGGRREFLALHQIKMLARENDLAVLVVDLDLLNDITVIGALKIVALFADSGFDRDSIADINRADEAYAVVAI